MLWNKCIALDPANIAGFLYTDNVINFIKKSLKEKYNHKFDETEIKESIDKIVFEEISLDQIKHIKVKKTLKPALPKADKAANDSASIESPVITLASTSEQVSDGATTN